MLSKEVYIQPFLRCFNTTTQSVLEFIFILGDKNDSYLQFEGTTNTVVSDNTPPILCAT